jgi:hypothetical protein
VVERGEKGGLSREVWQERELELEASGKACEKRRGQEGRPKRLERKKSLKNKNKKIRENRRVRTCRQENHMGLG